MVVSGRGLVLGVLGTESWGILALVDGLWGQKPIFHECPVYCSFVLVGILGCLSGEEEGCIYLDSLFCTFLLSRGQSQYSELHCWRVFVLFPVLC